MRQAINRSENELAIAGTPPRRRGCGCLGCLGQSAAALLLGGILMLAITAMLMPWAFHLGGSFHIIPYWQGWGVLHAQSGNYPLWVQFEPSTRGSRILPASHVSGISYLCTPKGERFRMNLGGSMRRNLPVSTDGEAISLYMYNWPALFGGFMTDHRPSIEVRGHWKNPNLEMDDHGSIYRAFQADGSLYQGQGHGPSRPYMGEVVPVTIGPGSKSDFEAACRAARR